MRTLFLFPVVFALQLHSLKAQKADTIIVNGTNFLFVKCTEPFDAYGKMDSLWKVYRVENGNRKYLLKHYSYRLDGDCNTAFTDHGAYSVHDDSIIFTTVHDMDGGPNPGAAVFSKQIYVVRNSGKLILVYDRDELNTGEERDNLTNTTRPLPE